MNIMSFQNFIKKSLLFIVAYIFTVISLFFYFTYQHNNNINRYLEDLKKQYQTQYNIIYQSFYKLSQNSFYGIINKPEIYDYVKLSYQKDEQTQNFYRQKLYEKLLPDYNRLKEFRFEQIQFYFPDNSSFLKMNKSEKLADNLEEFRSSINSVNKNLKPIDGYEINKDLNGFKFIYPLFDESLFHIGSIEISVNSDFIDKSFEEYFNVDSHFLVKKSIGELKKSQENNNDYQISYENSNYVYLENIKEEVIHYTSLDFYSNDEKKLIELKMQNAEDFILYKKFKDNYVSIYFFPIIDIEGNKNNAYLVLYKHSNFIEEIKHNYYNMILILFLSTFVFIIYIKYKYKKIQEEKNSEDILSQQAKMVALGEMIQSISHQWRQPLSVMSMLASGLKLKKECNILEDKEFNESLDAIVANTAYLSQTIEDFRNYFNESLEKKSFNLRNIITQCLSMFKEEVNSNNTVIIENVDEIELNTYEGELKQVLINLLKNAIELTKDGVILIKAYEKKDEIRIEIQDSAGGIPKDIIKKVFEPYFTTKHKSLGIGLGLFSSYEIVNNSLNGNVFVENKEFNYNFKTYVGACFSIVLYKDKL